MAEEFLEEIYCEAALRTKLKCLLEQMTGGNDGSWRQDYQQVISDLEMICRKYSAMNQKDAIELWNDLCKLQEYSNRGIERSDFMELNILPKIEKHLGRQNKICVDDEQGYCLESSVYGFLTLKNTESGKYFHSKNDPMWEARQIVKKFYDPAIKSYFLLGCGLGYIAYQLYCISDGSVPINVYEHDDKMIQYARKYGVLDWIPEECLNVTVDADALPFLQDIAQDEGHGYYIFKPEEKQWPEDTWEIIKTLIVYNNTATAFNEIKRRNFYRNLQSDAQPLACYNKDKLSEHFIIVAGGPSVDDGLDFLRQQKGNMSIIAIGAIFSRLVTCGIIPDMATIIDPQPITMKQLEGMTDQEVPLFLSITAYWKLARSYKGEKYLVPTMGDTPEERYYEKLYEEIAMSCPGTVTMLAVNLALYFGAKKVYLLGADFAFPEERYYAAGATGGSSIGNKGDLFFTESVGGGTVYTDKIMTMYRDSLEELISNTPDVTFYNLSKGGARIAGTIEI